MIKLLKILLLSVWCLLESFTLLPGQVLPVSGVPVWLSEDDNIRFQVAYFRNTFDLTNVPERGQLSLFADSRYHLIVNGTFLSFGPARAYPEHPMYDTLDIVPFLKEGVNTISVIVISNGTATFQLRHQPPAFWAWGDIGGTSLETPGTWKAHRAEGYDAAAPRGNFATGPVEIYDERLDADLRGWQESDYDDGSWQTPVTVPRDHWGDLFLRDIPMLTNHEILPYQIVNQYSLDASEDLFSFQQSNDDRSMAEFRKSLKYLGYTYIHSPEAQNVTVGVGRGIYYLNGQKVEPTDDYTSLPPRANLTLSLHEGWNEFKVGGYSHFANWAFIMTIPQETGLTLSPDKRASEVYFRHTLPMDPQTEVDSLLKLSLKELKSSNTWKDRSLQSVDGNPTLDVAFQPLIEKSVSPYIYDAKDIEIDSGGGALVVDFRYKRLGRLVVEYEGPPSTVFDAAFSEDLLHGRPNVSKRYGLTMSVRHISGSDEGCLESLRPYGIRYVQLNVRNNSAPVKIKRIYIREHVYPFDRIGRFECSDPLMNAIWEMGWRTVQVCAEDSYTDTPYRERALYAGDMLPQMGVTLAGANDLNLIRRSLDLFIDMYTDLFHADGMRHHDEIGLLEDYPLLTVESLRWYVSWTEDLGYLKKVYPHFAHMIRHYLRRRGEDGLILSNRVFIEWTQIEKSNVKNTAFHAILSRVCHLMSELAMQVGEESDATFFKEESIKIGESLIAAFWDDESGHFLDGIKDDSLIQHAYSISSIWPYLAGLTDEKKSDQIFPYVLDQLQEIGTESRRKRVTPYGSFYVLKALAQEGEIEHVEDFIRRHWGIMIHKHDDTAWENFDDVGVGTLSHAWSAAPTYLLSSEILGVNLGWPHPVQSEEVTIAPQSASLDWAEGTVPHPKGPIFVAWEVKGEQLFLTYQVPKDVKVSVSPRGRLSRLNLWVNGKRAQQTDP